MEFPLAVRERRKMLTKGQLSKLIYLSLGGKKEVIFGATLIRNCWCFSQALHRMKMMTLPLSERAAISYWSLTQHQVSLTQVRRTRIHHHLFLHTSKHPALLHPPGPSSIHPPLTLLPVLKSYPLQRLPPPLTAASSPTPLKHRPTRSSALYRNMSPSLCRRSPPR